MVAVLLAACCMHTAALSSKLAEYAQRNHLNRGDSTMAAPAPRGRVKEPLTKSQGMQSNALSLLAKYRQTKQGFAAEPEPEEQEVVDDAEVLKQMAENVELTQAFLDMDFNPEQVRVVELRCGSWWWQHPESRVVPRHTQQGGLAHTRWPEHLPGGEADSLVPPLPPRHG